MSLEFSAAALCINTEQKHISCCFVSYQQYFAASTPVHLFSCFHKLSRMEFRADVTKGIANDNNEHVLLVLPTDSWNVVNLYAILFPPLNFNFQGKWYAVFVREATLDACRHCRHDAR